MEAAQALLSISAVQNHPAVSGIVLLMASAMILGGLLIDQTRLSGRFD